MNTSLKIGALASAVILPTWGMAQQINVVVNGETVVFSGVGPRQVNGHVLVPLRGVMEKLGAYVDYNGSTKTINANKSGFDVTLRLGDRNATVNGRTVVLEVPAEQFAGSTMVPLRFVGEALGADVRWNAATYTVNITTTDNGVPPTDPNEYHPPRNNPPAGEAVVTSFDVDRNGTLRGGEELRLTLIGTPGGEATFSIPGVIQDIAMNETQPGTYVGTFRVPANSPINISKANAVAHLRVNGKDRVIQASSSLGFDTQPPTINSVTPDPETRVTRDRPNISATFDDAGGSGVDPRSVEVRVDRRPVTADAQVTPTFVSYRPDQALKGGNHEVSIVARDLAGNEVTKTWSFRVVTNNDVIRSFTYSSGEKDIQPGSEVVFTLVGEPGGKATFSIGDRLRDHRMQEAEPGKYVGRYTMRRNDDFQDTPVVAKFTTSAGDVFTYEAPIHFNAQMGDLEAPSITDPVDNSKVGNKVVLRGNAAPGSRIKVIIDYVRVTLGILRTTGNVAEIEITADDHGHWQTDPIDLSTGLVGGPTTFNVSATTLGRQGKTSSLTKITLKR